MHKLDNPLPKWWRPQKHTLDVPANCRLKQHFTEALLTKALEDDDNSSEDVSLPVTDLDSEDSWRPDSKFDSDESFVIPPSPANNKVPNFFRVLPSSTLLHVLSQVDNTAPDTPPVQVVKIDACAPLAQVDNTAPDTPPVQVVNTDAFAPLAQVDNTAPDTPPVQVVNTNACAPLAQVDNTAPDTPPVQEVNTDACAPSASVKNAALYVPGVPSNNAATNAPLAPNNNEAGAPSPVAPTTNEVVMRGRRRKRNPSSWKHNVIASKRLRGEEYIEHRRKIHSAASEGPACNCNKKCFQKPSLDTCKTCDKLEMDSRTNPLDGNINREQELHLRKAEAGQEIMKNDFEASKANNGQWTIAFDFQQTLPTPHINTSVTFYSRQLWTNNLGIHDICNRIMHMWSEDVARRGSNEVLSSLNRYFSNKALDASNRIAWSDSCGGQNKNKDIISFWYYLVHVKQIFKSIENKFAIPGHTFLLCERDFGVIEKKKGKYQQCTIPRGGIALWKKAKTNNPFQVVRMKRQDFIDIAPMRQQLIFRNTAADGSKVKLQKATRIKVSQDNPGYYFIAYSHNVDKAWQQVRIGRSGMQKRVQPQALYWGR
ncbi:hypothetical protein PoB_000604100 [Plakobranchus ocellatus]|uniref:DUF7869 domain-containing protein n=1 Tax=Plakobranchus ocellatus TaxID=259542 RepID=A0AAV3XX30_9GAST|nr:hypothetical protein PoB_000604100 [Plakobranchus ocellatus]